MSGKSNDSLVLSYLSLRRSVGVIGITLPFVLAFGKIFLQSPGIQTSISAYYYTVMRGVFVGALWAIGVFLYSYHGYEKQDDVAGDLACIFAIGTALFPTTPSLATELQMTIGRFHLAFAASFFLTLAYFALVLFRKTNQNGNMTKKKRQRNMVYTICGCTIIACIVLIALLKIAPQYFPVSQLTPVFWLEALAIFSFGFSWFVKGEAILAD